MFSVDILIVLIHSIFNDSKTTNESVVDIFGRGNMY